MPGELDTEEARAREEGWTFDRDEMLKTWREQGWPGFPSPENARIIEAGRYWAAYEDLGLAQQATGLEVAEHEVVGVMARLSLARAYWSKRWRKEAKERRE